MRYYPDPKDKTEYIDIPVYYEENLKLVLEKYNKKAKEIEQEMRTNLCDKGGQGYE